MNLQRKLLVIILIFTGVYLYILMIREKIVIGAKREALRGSFTNIVGTNKLVPSHSIDSVINVSGPEAKFKAAFQTPITFYGRVIDQNGEPVPDADIEFLALDDPVKPSSKYFRKSDSFGNFSISEIVGAKLAVAVSKKLYLRVPREYPGITSSAQFDYYDVGAGTYKPNEIRPSFFKLYKLGVLEPLDRLDEESFRIPKNGEPIFISLDLKKGHFVILRCWTKNSESLVEENQYEWKFEITVPRGGLISRKDDFIFEAPEEGYSEKDIIDMPASLPTSQWRDFAVRSYFIKFEDGTYARASFQMRAYGDYHVTCDSFFNSKIGSRNLEFDFGGRR